MLDRYHAAHPTKKDKKIKKKSTDDEDSMPKSPKSSNKKKDKKSKRKQLAGLFNFSSTSTFGWCSNYVWKQGVTTKRRRTLRKNIQVKK
jgi:hypothetical protein